jgi:hypothetical protein
MEVVAVEDLAGGADATQFTATELFRRPAPDRPLVWTGQVPVRLGRNLEASGCDVRRLLSGDPAVTW